MLPWVFRARILLLVDSSTSVRAVGHRRALGAVMALVAMSGRYRDTCTLLALVIVEVTTLATRRRHIGSTDSERTGVEPQRVQGVYARYQKWSIMVCHVTSRGTRRKGWGTGATHRRAKN